MERVRRLETVRQALLPRLNFDTTANSKVPGLDTEQPSHLIIRDEDGTRHQMGYLFLPSSAAPTGRRVLAYQIDEKFVLTELFSNLGGTEELGNKVHAGLYNEEEPLTSLPNAPSPAQALAIENLSQYFPWWRLVLFDNQGKTVDQIVRKEKKLYGAILLGIFVLILAGVIMTLQAATHEAEIARLRSDFVSNVSHELKTPLSLIRLFGETLESDQLKDGEKRKEFSRIIARESQRLSYLIDNVLDFSKIDSGRKEYVLAKEDLVKVLSNTLETYQFYLRDQGFEFDVSLPRSPIIMPMDKDAMVQAFLNLLNNAEKYSGERKHIGVKMIAKKDEAWITVEDRGSGIPPSDLKHIFEKFFRVEHGPAREVQGCGLGLTIVKNTVESHGGRISVESEVGKGSRFIIKLPLKGKGNLLNGFSESENGKNPHH
jgi:signal transduction histidine kinase